MDQPGQPRGIGAGRRGRAVARTTHRLRPGSAGEVIGRLRNTGPNGRWMLVAGSVGFGLGVASRLVARGRAVSGPAADRAAPSALGMPGVPSLPDSGAFAYPANAHAEYGAPIVPPGGPELWGGT